MTRDRSCLHCVLARVMEIEGPAFARVGLALSVGSTEPTWLPESGMRTYRRVRRLLADVRRWAEPGPVRLSLHGILPERSQVEVVASFRSGRRSRSCSCLLPRFLEPLLRGGMAEGAHGGGYDPMIGAGSEQRSFAFVRSLPRA